MDTVCDCFGRMARPARTSVNRLTTSLETVTAMVNLVELLQKLEQGFYVTPEIQRGYVWGNSQVRDLVASIYSEYPIGSIVTWEMPNKFSREYSSILTTLVDGLSAENRRYLIVDGRQRLTSILLVARGEVKIGKETRRIGLYFNPVSEEFKLSKGSKFEKDPAWFSVTELLRRDADAVLKAKATKTGVDVSRNPITTKNLGQLKLRLGRYDVPIYGANLGDPDDFPNFVERLSDIFVTLNRTGTRITLSDLVLALLTGAVRRTEGKSFREQFEKLTTELTDTGFRVDEAALIRTFMAIATGLTRFSKAQVVLEGLKGSEIIERFADTGASVRELVRILKGDIGVRGPDDLNSRYLVAPLAYAVHRDFLSVKKAIGATEVQSIRNWIVAASIKGRYTGELERLLSEDIETIKSGKGFQGLIDSLGKVTIPGSSLSGDLDRVYRTVLSVLMFNNDAPDWEDKPGRPTPVSQIDNGRIEYHHIFPKDYMRKVKFARMEIVEDVANLTIISKTANGNISASPPSTYLAKLVERDSDSLKMHFVPSDRKLWEPKQFKNFLIERRRLIGAALTDLTGFEFHSKD